MKNSEKISRAEKTINTGTFSGVIGALLGQFDELIASSRRYLPGKVYLYLLVTALVSTLVYGFATGTFSMGTQLIAAPLKVLGVLLISSLICFPSFYIFLSLSGLRISLKEAASAIFLTFALLALLLLGFAPVIWLFSQSTDSLFGVGFLHLAIFTIAMAVTMKKLSKSMQTCNEVDAEDEVVSTSANKLKKAKEGSFGLRFWSMIYVLVILQMTCVLRPIIGTSEKLFSSEKKFFIEHWTDATKTKDKETKIKVKRCNGCKSK